jgi:hypothetical protein
VGTGPIERRLRELGGVKARLSWAPLRSTAPTSTRPSTVDGLAEVAIPRTSHHYLVDPSKLEGEGGSKITAVRGFRRCSPERTVSTLAITPLLRRRSSGQVSGRSASAGSAGISDVARLGIHTQAALQNTSFNDT